MLNKTTKENINIALRAVRSQGLRSTLTVLIIAFGIMALVGILTSIDAIENKFQSDFSLMGSNTFTIMNRNFSFSRNDQRKRTKVISFKETHCIITRQPSRLQPLPHELQRQNINPKKPIPMSELSGAMRITYPLRDIRSNLDETFPNRTWVTQPMWLFSEPMFQTNYLRREIWIQLAKALWLEVPNTM